MHQTDYNDVVSGNLTETERGRVIDRFNQIIPQQNIGLDCSDILSIVDALNTYLQETNDAWEEFPGARAEGFEAAVSALLLIGEPLTESRLKELLRQ